MVQWVARQQLMVFAWTGGLDTYRGFQIQVVVLALVKTYVGLNGFPTLGFISCMSFLRLIISPSSSVSSLCLRLNEVLPYALLLVITFAIRLMVGDGSRHSGGAVDNYRYVSFVFKK